jgi:proteic killer suppression protein
MEIQYGDDDLHRLAVDPAFEGGYPPSVVKVYRKRIQLIKGAADERDFYALRSLHYEKLKGQRAHQRSMRLNDQWRLVLELIDGNSGKLVRIAAIEDYH